MSAPWLSVVIPAYNERDGIAAAVGAARDHLERLGRPYELIVVDNASEDGTTEAVEALADGEVVRLLRNERNRGKGFSMRRGMGEARGELLLHCDADCTPSFASLDRMLALIEEADVVVGSRLAAGASLGRRQPLPRRVVGRSFQLLCRLVLREPTSDLFCGFKLWRREAAAAVFPRIGLDGWVFDAEALALARALGFRLREVGIVWSDRSGSRLAVGRVLVPVVLELLRARAAVRREAARAGAAHGAEPAVATPSDSGR